MNSLKVAFFIVLLSTVVGIVWENFSGDQGSSHLSRVHAASSPSCHVPTKNECQKLFPEAFGTVQDFQNSYSIPITKSAQNETASQKAFQSLKSSLHELAKKSEDKEKEKAPSGGGGSVKNNFPQRTYRFVSKAVNIANGGGESGWIRLGFKFDGVTQTFVMETCPRDPTKQWPKIWNQMQTSLDSLYEEETKKLWTRLPIVYAGEQLSALDPTARDYDYGVSFDANEIINSQATTMIFEHLLSWGGSDKFAIQIWQLDRESELNQEWTCDWKAIK